MFIICPLPTVLKIQTLKYLYTVNFCILYGSRIQQRYIIPKEINRLIFMMESLSAYCDRTLFDVAYVLRNICKVKTKYL
jgi:hypothetical protein